MSVTFWDLHSIKVSSNVNDRVFSDFIKLFTWEIQFLVD